MLNKTNPVNRTLQSNNPQSSRPGINEIHGQTMKTRYVAVLEGNINTVRSKDGCNQKDTKPQMNGEDNRSVQYTEINNSTRSENQGSDNIDKSYLKDQNAAKGEDDCNENEMKLQDKVEDTSSIKYTDVEILSKSKEKISDQNQTNITEKFDKIREKLEKSFQNDPNIGNTKHDGKQNESILQIKAEDIFSLQYTTLKTSPRSLSDSTIYSNQYLINIDKKYLNDLKGYYQDMENIGRNQIKKLYFLTQKDIVHFDTFPKRYQNGKTKSSYSIV